MLYWKQVLLLSHIAQNMPEFIMVATFDDSGSTVEEGVKLLYPELTASLKGQITIVQSEGMEYGVKDKFSQIFRSEAVRAGHIKRIDLTSFHPEARECPKQGFVLPNHGVYMLLHFLMIVAYLKMQNVHVGSAEVVTV